MPWMLLREPDLGTRDAGDSVSDRAWVLVGGLEEALQQSGIVSGLLDRTAPPALIVCAGFSSVNALLAAAGDKASFWRGWEQLREKRLLVTSALCTNRLLGSVNGLFEPLSRGLAASMQTPGVRPGVRTKVFIAVNDGFVRLHGDVTPGEWHAAIRGSLRQTPRASPALVAAAIREAAGLADDVLVVGVERTTQTHPDVETTRRAADASGTAVAFVTMPSPGRPSLLQYLLPGSGAAERLQREGLSTVERWLRGNGSAVVGVRHSIAAALGAGSASPAAMLARDDSNCEK